MCVRERERERKEREFVRGREREREFVRGRERERDGEGEYYRNRMMVLRWGLVSNMGWFGWIRGC